MAFKKGNTASAGVSKGKTGRPSKKREERFYEIALRACTFKDWREIVKKAVEQAKEGDTAARKFLADYLMGPPTQRAEVELKGGVQVEYVNDWRPSTSSEPAPGTEDSN